MQTPTIRVFWKDKFEGQAVAISAGDYDPALHRLEADGPWLAPVPAESNADTDADADAIPADFPGAKALNAAGIETFAQLREVEDLTAVKGIGEATASAILAALEE